MREAERQLGVCRRLADAMPDRRERSRIHHAMFEMVMARSAGIACGHKDAIDHDRLRHDPLMKLAVGRCPQSGAPLASQSTISRLENAPRKTEAARLTAALVDQFGTTVKPGEEEVIDIDDTFCAAHGGQQLAFWNAHHDERGFATMHIHHVESGTPVAAILRPGRTPNGTEVRTVVKHVTRAHSPALAENAADLARRQPLRPRRGDGRGARTTARATSSGWPATACSMRCWRKPAITCASGTRSARTTKLRCYTSLQYKARSWSRPRRVIARIECSLRPDAKEPGYCRQEVDIRYVVTSLEGSPEHIYESVYCQRGQMENLIKLHKTQLASDRMSCHSATANQVRLVLHTAAFWLMHGVRAAIPATSPLAKAEFATIRERLVKIAARVIEHAARIRIQLPTSCPEGALFRAVALGLLPSGP